MLKSHDVPRRARRETSLCSHCGLPTKTREDNKNVFCCSGCMGAYAFIHELGLESYYDLRLAGTQTNGLVGDVETGDVRKSNFEILEDLQSAGVTVHNLSDGNCSVRLAVDGIHCAACTWLIERMQPTIPGLRSAQVRMSDQTVELIYDPSQTQPVDVSRKLAKLGYSLSPFTIDSEDTQGFQQQQREHWVGIALAAFFAANAMWIGVALYAGESTGISKGHETFLRWVGTLLALLAVFLPGKIFFYTAWQAIRTRTPHVDIPIALSLMMGVIGSVVGAASGIGHIYFDSLASLILLLRIGRFIQFRVQYRTSLSLARLLRWNMVTATRVASDGTCKTVPANRLQVGDQIRIEPGETIPADGIVAFGRSSVDTSLLTGESLPVSICAGDPVAGGTINLSASIDVSVHAAGADSRVGRLMGLVRNASSHRTPSIMAADRLSKWFVILVLTLAMVTWVVWTFRANTTVATQHTMALLTIACPCALALAAPLVITVALGRAARRQIWIRDGNCLERLATPGFLWLDKTGTLTSGRMSVLAWHGADDGLRYAAALEHTIHHAIAKAICEFAIGKESEGAQVVVHELGHYLGKGVQGKVDGLSVALGNEEWIRRQGTQFSTQWLDIQSIALSRDRTVVWLSIEGEVCGLFELGDPIRGDVVETLRSISEKGWRLGILSGDRQEIVDAMVGFLQEHGIIIEAALGDQSPEDKLEVIRRDKVNRDLTIAMVGDGVNDAAALAIAHVGIAIRGGGGQSLATAPIFLANSRISSVVELLEASVCVVRGIRRCFAASLIYNTVTVSLAMLGWIHPLIAAVLMPISGLTVLTMAMSTNAFPGIKSK